VLSSTIYEVDKRLTTTIVRHRTATQIAQLDDQIADGIRGQWVNPMSVRQEEQLGIPHQRTQCHPLLHAAGEFSRELILLVLEADELQQRQDLRSTSSSGTA
jgi:hypothetical protein